MSKLVLSLLVTALSLGALPVNAGRVIERDLVSIHVVDAASLRQLPTYNQENLVWVQGTPNEAYSLRLSNNSDTRVLAVLSVDGVNVITGKTASPSQSGYVIGPRDHVYIKGWRKSMDSVAEFKFGSVESSYAALTGRPDNLGVIGVAAFQEDVPSPILHKDIVQNSAPYGMAKRHSAAPSSLAGADRAAELGTQHGRKLRDSASYTEFQRVPGQSPAVSTVYYDSRRGLISRGVIPTPQRHRPNPFPDGFVPDPY